MTRTTIALFSAFTAGFGCNPTLGTITSEGQSSSAGSTTAASTSGGTASTDPTSTTAMGTGEISTSTTMPVDPSTTGDPTGSAGESTTTAGGSATGTESSTTGAEDSTTGEEDLYADCPVCTDSYQACMDHAECASILDSGCVDGDLGCIATAIEDHCGGANLYFAHNSCVTDNCGQPVCIAEKQACAASVECTSIQDCDAACGSCPGNESCKADCLAQASMNGLSLYNALVGCVLDPPLRAPQSCDRDYNGDLRDDVLWYWPGVDAERLFLGTATKNVFSEPVAPVITPMYSGVAGDFNGNGFSDVYLYAPGLPDQILDGGPGGAFKVVTPKDVAGRYIPIAGDFDGDGLDDLFWYAPGPAADHVSYATGGHAFAEVPAPVGGNFLPVAGDFDGDGRDDILWYGNVGSPEAVWYGNTSADPFVKTTTTDVSAGYLPFSGNFDPGGPCKTCDDIFWYSYDNADSIWNGDSDRNIKFVKSGAPILNGEAFDLTGKYSAAVPGDYDGNGHTDIIFYRRGDGPDFIWYGLSSNAFSDMFQFDIGGAYEPI